ncbi:MAG: hypothetical protein GWM98_05790, partial [Nitrospinaceae bacterium]|nr:hypothetical protein [Nitrospinaceae bacterium]NIR54070.1 hypothetical protein [Nitrospinaceae bacterium]NIT81283.1 hypothetical protein [Nitrospinaceae bacterium]NIU95688.1 hypothetical protein [Nitrospinaceae bacterium]NIW05162.1 hypothetical protein [Nitrospinaceae bacterium]
AVLFCFLVYLGVNYFHKGNSIFDYGVFAYFLVLIPLSRKFNVTAHAILASVGLVLLTVVATLNMFTPPP